MAEKKFSGKRVLITGAGSGIGYATAEAFSQAGAKIIATDVQQTGLDTLHNDLESKGGDCQTSILDVADEHAFQALADRLEAEGTLPDIVVNNAGIAHLDSFVNTGTQEWRQTIDINVMGVVFGSRVFIRSWQKTGQAGHLVNIASGASIAPMPNMAAYVASKYAVEGLSDVIAMELVDTNIDLSCVHPGVINTAIVKHNERMAVPAKQVNRLQRNYERRGASPSVVADAILKGVQNKKSNIFVGPGSAMIVAAKRLLPRTLYRKLLRSEAKKLGYL